MRLNYYFPFSVALSPLFSLLSCPLAITSIRRCPFAITSHSPLLLYYFPFSFAITSHSPLRFLFYFPITVAPAPLFPILRRSFSIISTSELPLLHYFPSFAITSASPLLIRHHFPFSVAPSLLLPLLCCFLVSINYSSWSAIQTASSFPMHLLSVSILLPFQITIQSFDILLGGPAVLFIHISFTISSKIRDRWQTCWIHN